MRKGTHHTPESLAKMSGAKLGKTLTEDVKAKISASNLGRKRPPFTEAHIAKMRIAALAREARKRAAREAQALELA